MTLADTLSHIDLGQTFAKCKVLVLGDIMLDCYWWGTVNRISPEAPVPVVKLQRVTHTAGGAANVAANVAGLGSEVMLVGSIGNDFESKLLVDELDLLGIDSAYLTKTKRPTSVKTRIVAHSQHVVRVDREENMTIDREVEAAITDSLEIAISKADIVILSDYAKGTLSRDVIGATLMRAARRGVPVLVDPKGRDFFRYKGASIITPNKREALEACRLEDSSPDLTAQAGNQLIRELDLSAVVITEGEKGMTLFERDKAPTSLTAAAHEIYDVTGAGDTVIATLAVALAAGMPLFEAVSLANIAAGLVVEQVGTTAISIDLLSRKLSGLSLAENKTDASQQ